MIWRRLLVSSETTIAQLHQYIQVAFNWSGEHWHRFRIHGKDYGIGYLGGINFADNPHAVRLSRFRLHPRESFRYEYDFIANWRVAIRLEEILPQDQRILPVCVGGRAAARGRICGSLSVFAAAGPPPLRVSVGRVGQDRQGDGALAGVAGTIRKFFTLINQFNAS